MTKVYAVMIDIIPVEIDGDLETIDAGDLEKVEETALFDELKRVFTHDCNRGKVPFRFFESWNDAAEAIGW